LADFFATKDHGKPTRAAGACGMEVTDVALEHVPIEEKEGGQSLILRAGGDVTLHGEVSEELFDLGSPQAVRVAEALSRPVEADEVVDPPDVALFRVDGEMADASDGADLIEEFHESGSRGFPRIGYCRSRRTQGFLCSAVALLGRVRISPCYAARRSVWRIMPRGAAFRGCLIRYQGTSDQSTKNQ
jgi:hypothetical protein